MKIEKGDILEHKYITDKKIEIIDIKMSEIFGKTYIVRDFETNMHFVFRYIGEDWKIKNEV